MSLATMKPRLLSVPMVGLYPVTVKEANHLLALWGHNLGPVNRPFHMEAYTLDIGERPISVAVSASIVSNTVAGYPRGEVVELARLCTDPSAPWATRLMLRLWREQCGPQWASWPVKAAVAYSQSAHHRGDIYRFDGWRKLTENAGSTGGGSWSRPRYANDAVYGKKTLWLWEYQHG